MKIAYFDCFSGISGDMILGALVDAGLELEALRAELARLNLPGWAVEGSRVSRGGITATRVEVKVSAEQPERHLSQIVDILSGGQLDAEVAEKAIGIFSRLAEVESGIHGIEPSQVHFHEVGAADALIDVVGTVAGLKLLGVEQVFASAVRLGKGFVQCRHGTLPVPVPATLALLKGVPVERSEVPAELVTPTGAALITGLAEGFGSAPPMTLEQIGRGAGGRDLKELPNLLRVFIGRTGAGCERDQAILLETNIDDMNPELYGSLVEILLGEGALDAYLMPVVMKKGRPAVILSVLASEEKAERLTEMIFGHTTTLGVRIHRVNRIKLPRRIGWVKTSWGKLRVKVATFQGRERISPEFEDCSRVARDHDLPLWQVYREAHRAWERGEVLEDED
jgi:uncharacterized protein (TIGR00299 family) protein